MQSLGSAFLVNPHEFRSDIGGTIIIPRGGMSTAPVLPYTPDAKFHAWVNDQKTIASTYFCAVQMGLMSPLNMCLVDAVYIAQLLTRANMPY